VIIDLLQALLMAETDEEEQRAVAMPPVLLQIIAWVLGEYASLVAETVWRNFQIKKKKSLSLLYFKGNE